MADVAMSEEELEKTRQHNFQLGISTGFSRASGMLMEEACARFAAQKDEDAKTFRDWARRLHVESERERPEESEEE